MEGHKLKPCPFCGGFMNLNASDNKKTVFCSCYSCGARGPVVEYKGIIKKEDTDYAIALWNRRSDDGE